MLAWPAAALEAWPVAGPGPAFEGQDGGYLQLPLVAGGRRVGVRFARQLHVLAVQEPVAVKALNGDLRLICEGGEQGRAEDSGYSRGPLASCPRGEEPHLFSPLFES